MDTPRAGGWDLKRYVKTNRDPDGITRYVEGYTPLGVDASRCPITKEHVTVHIEKPPTRKEKIVLATVGADAHVNGINVIREAFQDAGYDVVFLRGMNLPETVAEVAAEANADAVGVSNLLGLGVTLFPRVEKRLKELGLRDTHFTNPNGLDAPEHYSTALDLARLTRAALQVPAFAEVVATRQITIEARSFTNHNRLLWSLDGAIGVKTGYTRAAGRTLVSAVERTDAAHCRHAVRAG